MNCVVGIFLPSVFLLVIVHLPYAIFMSSFQTFVQYFVVKRKRQSDRMLQIAVNGISNNLNVSFLFNVNAIVFLHNFCLKYVYICFFLIFFSQTLKSCLPYL